MKIDLTDIPVYYINLDDQEEKRKNTETMLKQMGFKFVERFSAIRHEAGRIIGCARSHYEILKSHKPPFIIIEDDCSLNKEFDKNIEIPDNVDARKFWLNWLKINNFYSTVSGYQNLSYNHNVDGGAFGKDNYITLVITDNNPPLILEDTTNLN
jgi:hypothetical protein